MGIAGILASSECCTGPLNGCLQMAWLQELESEKRGEKVEAVLVGHSNGGGLSQSILSEGDVKTKALVLVETIPCFGS